MKRRDLLASLLAAALPAWAAASPTAPPPRTGYIDDFDALWSAIARSYPHFDRGSRERFKRSRASLRAQAAHASTPAELAQLVQAIAEILRDEQVSVPVRSPRPARRIPAQTDMWASWHGAVARIEAVRASSEADVAGVHPGHVVERIHEIPSARAVAALVGRAASLRDRNWALRKLLAGPWSGSLSLDVRDAARAQRIEIARHAPTRPGHAMLTRRMGEARDIGYIRLQDHAWEVAGKVMAALSTLLGTRALILDLRDVSSSAPSRALAPILQPFTSTEQPWLVRHELRGKPQANRVTPGDVRYTAPVVALVDRWTAGAGENLAAGLSALGARLIGTPMAGLATDVAEVRLPQSGLVVQLPAAFAFHIDGTRVERIRPSVPVDLEAPSGGPGDPILYQALKLLEKG